MDGRKMVKGNGGGGRINGERKGIGWGGRINVKGIGGGGRINGEREWGGTLSL